MPHLGLRKVSQVTIPAELPGGTEMGKHIDEKVKPDMMKLPNIREPAARLSAVRSIKEKLEKGFEEYVEGSPQYKALYTWTDKLKLKSEQSKVRPTVHEIYIFRDGSHRKELISLLRDRDRLRLMAQRRPDPNLGGIRFAYPEEFEPSWIRRMGRLLGYPDCCVDRYAEDRAKGINVEARAANQLAEAAKGGQSINPYAYPLGYFFPCKPDCPESTALGTDLHEKLEELDPKIGAMYEEMARVNAHMVLKQPELIQRYLSQFQSGERDKSQKR